MDSKAFLCLVFFAITVTCQYDVSHLINTTQHMQDLERGGIGHQNLYPQLNMSENHVGDENKNQSILVPSIPKSLNVSRTALEKFINETLRSMPNGICVKEVPTASLLTTQDAHVRGNGSDPSLSRIQTCCDGYQQNKHIFRKCEPICSEKCVNGICTSPETCTCFPNFVRTEAGECIVTCPVGCPNGVCNSDNSCSCNQGYTQEPNGKFCSPKCDKKCMNGRCSGPNQCTCSKGYVKDTTDSYRCVPTCNPTCENGMCSGPNMCLCYSGYIKDRSVKSGHKCVKK